MDTSRDFNGSLEARSTVDRLLHVKAALSMVLESFNQELLAACSSGVMDSCRQVICSGFGECFEKGSMKAEWSDTHGGSQWLISTP
jgi:hypothetical protein